MEKNYTKLLIDVKNNPQKYEDVFSLIGRYILSEKELLKWKNDESEVFIDTSVANVSLEAVSVIMDNAAEIACGTEDNFLYIFDVILSKFKNDPHEEMVSDLISGLGRKILNLKFKNREAYYLSSAFGDIKNTLKQE